MDLILGHSYEGDRPRNRADCGLHSLPMDGPGSDLHLAGWKSRDVRLNQRPSAPVGRQTVLRSKILTRISRSKYEEVCRRMCRTLRAGMRQYGLFRYFDKVLPCGLGY